MTSTLLIDRQNVYNDYISTYDVQSIEAVDYPYTLNPEDLYLADCYAAAYLYEGMFGNERAVEFANEGFRKFVKD